ncbi:MAG: hypothetical protein K0S07_561 [Chlamydiales bacterium]|jgi:UDP-2-acetamido-3-amino-2,3-dideoxy-glucuronate N-acetyltransferase|nr:hypothetical protein [Chlamydiales bacterium]
MSEVKYRREVALVGVGRWGKNIARNLQALNALHTICDTNHHSALSKQDYPDVALTSDYQAVLDHPKIKQVMIATPPISHYELAKRALFAGKDVYVEKPLCLNYKEGQELIEIAHRLGRILMVGHLLHYHPYVRKVQEMVGSAEIGKVQYIVSNRLNLGSFRLEENALWNFAPHDISVILSLVGFQLPEKVRCTGASYISKGIVDKSLTTLSFADDVRAHIYVSWLNPFKEQKLTVVGSSGMLVFDDTQDWDHKLTLYRNLVTWVDETIPISNEAIPEPIIVPRLEPLREECRHFLDCCYQRVSPKTDGVEGLRVLQVLEAAQASLNEDGEVKTP